MVAPTRKFIISAGKRESVPQRKGRGDVPRPSVFSKSAGIVVEITLDVDDGSTLVTGAGGQVTQGADQVGQAAGGSTLGSHGACQIALCPDCALNGSLQIGAGQGSEIIVSQILQLQLIGSTLKTSSVSGGYNRIGQLPDLANGILECAVTVNHYFNLLAGCVVDFFLNCFNQRLAVAGEELYLLLGGLVGAEQTVFCVESTSVYGCGENLVKTVNSGCTCCAEKSLCSRTGVNVAVDYVLGVVQNSAGIVCENDLKVCTALANELFIELNVVNTCEAMLLIAEELAVLVTLKWQKVM